MRKIFCVMILLAAMLICGCDFFVANTADDKINVSGKNVDSNDRLKSLVDVVDSGGILSGAAEIEKGNIDIIIGDKVYNFDKTQEISIDLAAGKYNIFFAGHDDFTGELKLHVIPNMPKI